MTHNIGNTVSRRGFLGTGSALALAALTGTARRAPAQITRSLDRPHVLFLMADQYRGDCLGADGHPAVKTPHLDGMAAEGARFRCAYSSTPTCTPARAALLTGMSPWSHGMLGYHKVAEKYPVELPQLMRDAGYYTMGLGKMHWSPQRALHGFHRTLLDESGREQSVDFRSDYRAWFASEAPNLDPDATGIGWNDYRAANYVLPERLHPTAWTGQVAAEFISTYERPEPFFFKVSFARPHSPYDPPQRWMDAYEDCEIPAALQGDWAGRYRPRSDDSNQIWHGDMGAAQVRHSRQGYYGSVAFLDEQIGRIIEALDRRGWLDETLILFCADHGDMTGDHHLWRKSYAYEASARIPMLMRWPGGLLEAPRGHLSEKPTEIRDILPTCLAAAGAAVPEAVEGRSLLDAVTGKGDPWREAIDLEHDICYSPANHWSALTDGRTKYIFHARDGEEQLFDLVADPGEERDLAGDTAHAETLRKWRHRLITHLEPRGDEWVKGGRLSLRPKSILHSPNYPGT